MDLKVATDKVFVLQIQWEVKKSKKKGQVDYSQEPASSSSDTRTKGPSRGTGNKSAVRAGMQ